MKRRILLAGIMALAAAAPAFAQGKKDSGGDSMTHAVNVTGSYTAKGMNADGSKYDGAVTILQEGDAVAFTWVIGDDTFKGTGQVIGMVVEVDWGDAAPVIYVARPDGELHGTWASGTALEKLVPN